MSNTNTNSARSVAIVSGGANGIGKAIVKKLVIAGHEVVFSDLNEEAGKALESELGSNVSKFVRADVTSEEDWKVVVDTTLQKFGRIDALVNNAGIAGPRNQDPVSLDTQAMIHCFTVHVAGAQLGIKTVFPHFDKEKGGVVVNTSSQASTAGAAAAGLLTAYAIAKAGVDMLTRAVVTCHPQVRCYSMNPSFFDTDLGKSIVEIPLIQAIGLKTFEQVCFAFNPLGKAGKLEALADLYLNAIEGTHWKFINGASVGVVPNQKDGVYTYLLDQMLAQVNAPLMPWAYEPLLHEDFSFCDPCGNPLKEDELKEFRSALEAHKAEVLKTA